MSISNLKKKLAYQGPSHGVLDVAGPMLGGVDLPQLLQPDAVSHMGPSQLVFVENLKF